MGAEGSRPEHDEVFAVSLRRVKRPAYLVFNHESPELLAEFGPAYLPTAKIRRAGECFRVHRTLLLSAFKKPCANVLVTHEGERIELKTEFEDAPYYLINPNLSYYVICLADTKNSKSLQRVSEMITSFEKARPSLVMGAEDSAMLAEGLVLETTQRRMSAKPSKRKSMAFGSQSVLKRQSMQPAVLNLVRAARFLLHFIIAPIFDDVFLLLSL
jgi:hypothetical protein